MSITALHPSAVCLPPPVSDGVTQSPTTCCCCSYDGYTFVVDGLEGLVYSYMDIDDSYATVSRVTYSLRLCHATYTAEHDEERAHSQQCAVREWWMTRLMAASLTITSPLASSTSRIGQLI